MSCDKKEQMNLLRYHFTYHYLCSKCLIYLDCLNETFIVPHFSSLATCSFRDWLSPASSDIHKFLTGHRSLAPLPRSLVFVLSHYQGPRCLDPTDFQATKSGLLQPWPVQWTVSPWAHCLTQYFKKHILVRCLNKYGLKFCRYIDRSKSHRLASFYNVSLIRGKPIIFEKSSVVASTVTATTTVSVVSSNVTDDKDVTDASMFDGEDDIWELDWWDSDSVPFDPNACS